MYQRNKWQCLTQTVRHFFLFHVKAHYLLALLCICCPVIKTKAVLLSKQIQSFVCQSLAGSVFTQSMQKR